MFTLKVKDSTISFNLPLKEFSFDEASIEALELKVKHLAHDILGSFSSYLIKVLEARQEACLTKLLSHITDAYQVGPYTVEWKRKNGTYDHFSKASFEAMTEGIELLKNSNWEEFLNETLVLDQTIKALLNMPNLDHSDQGGFRFSELVSLLMECYMFVDRISE